MNFIELVKKRQSCRNYLPTIIPRDVIDRCLEAARLAPSASNSQPWSFIVIDDPKLIKQVSDAAFAGVYLPCSFARKAPVLIIAVREPADYLTRLGGAFRGIQYNLIDIGIACEHLVLQATEEGLGTCWIGWFSEKGVKKVLDLPKSRKVDIIISMGYPANQEVRNKIRKPLDQVRRFWQ